MSRGAFDLGDNLGFSASGKTVFETPRVLVKSRRETGNFWIEILWSGYFFLFFFPPLRKIETRLGEEKFEQNCEWNEIYSISSDNDSIHFS